MNKVKYEMQIPKESKEVVDLLDLVLKKVLSKAPLSEYAAILPNFLTAIEGLGELKAEVGSDGRDELAGYLVHKLLGTLLPSEKK